MNIFAMAREGLRIELAGVIRRAIAQKKGVIVKRLKYHDQRRLPDHQSHRQPSSESEGMRGLLMVVFEDVGTPSEQRGARARRKTGSVSQRASGFSNWRRELAHTKEHLQTTVEEMETSQEELKSANEELQSANEELQSTEL